MTDIIMWAIIILGGGVGIISTLYMVISIPVVIVWKIFRSIKNGCSLYA